jgi:anti-sigma regulatory factor (Ser/Thr protein kinase)
VKRRFFRATAPQRIAASRFVFALQLCLEAVANIIMYGGAKDEQLDIAVELERNGGTLAARIEG